MTRRAQVVDLLEAVRDARDALVLVDRALLEILSNEVPARYSPIDARDVAYTYVRKAIDVIAPLPDRIGNLPGIDPWDPDA